MTVADLIACLQTYPRDVPVVIPGIGQDEGARSDIHLIKLIPRVYANRTDGKRCYMDPHNFDAGDLPEVEVVSLESGRGNL